MLVPHMHKRKNRHIIGGYHRRIRRRVSQMWLIFMWKIVCLSMVFSHHLNTSKSRPVQHPSCSTRESEFRIPNTEYRMLNAKHLILDFPMDRFDVSSIPRLEATGGRAGFFARIPNTQVQIPNAFIPNAYIPNESSLIIRLIYSTYDIRTLCAGHRRGDCEVKEFPTRVARKVG